MHGPARPPCTPLHGGARSCTEVHAPARLSLARGCTPMYGDARPCTGMHALARSSLVRRCTPLHGDVRRCTPPLVRPCTGVHGGVRGCTLAPARRCTPLHARARPAVHAPARPGTLTHAGGVGRGGWPGLEGGRGACMATLWGIRGACPHMYGRVRRCTGVYALVRRCAPVPGQVAVLATSSCPTKARVAKTEGQTKNPGRIRKSPQGKRVSTYPMTGVR